MMYHKYCTQERQRWFTLTELLIVIAILAVLSSLVQTSLKSVFEKTQKIQCASNLKQLGSAAMMYEEDYDGEMVIARKTFSDAAVAWSGNGLPYYLGLPQDIDLTDSTESTVFSCPVQYGWLPLSRTYSENGGIFDSRSALLNRTSAPGRITITAATIPYFVDGVYASSWKVFQDWRGVSQGDALDPSTDNGHPWSLPHNRGTNIVFLDGHVQWTGAEEDIWKIKFRPGKPGGPWAW